VLYHVCYVAELALVCLDHHYQSLSSWVACPSKSLVVPMNDTVWLCLKHTELHKVERLKGGSSVRSHVQLDDVH